MLLFMCMRSQYPVSKKWIYMHGAKCSTYTPVPYNGTHGQQALISCNGEDIHVF